MSVPIGQEVHAEASNNFKIRKETPPEKPCHCCSTKRKTIWTLICLLALAGCISQCIDRLYQYIYNPTTINVRNVENNTITAPCVTLCPSDVRNRYPALWPARLRVLNINISYSSVFALLKETNITVEELWELSKIPIQTANQYATDQGGFPIDSIGHMPAIVGQDLDTVLGACRTYIPEKDIPYYGTETGLLLSAYGDPPESIFRNTTPEYKVIFHSKARLPDIKYYARNLASTLPYGKPLNYAIRFRETISLNTWQNPCKSEDELVECISRCVTDHIVARSPIAKCRLPYMEKRPGVPTCKKPSEFHEVYNATVFVVRNLDLSIGSCSCGRACKQIHYEAEHISSIPAEMPGALYFLYVSFPSSRVERVEEDLNYPYTALFSDIGGAMGLFLGASILSLLSSLEEFWVRLRKHRFRVSDVVS